MNSEQKQSLILASASPRRRELLQQIHIKPDAIISPGIDETPQKGINPQELCCRLSLEKAREVARNNEKSFILAADTVVARGQRILDKTDDVKIAAAYLNQLSGRRHQVWGGITVITPNGQEITKSCLTKVQFKALSQNEIEHYLDMNEWQGKAGAYGIQGYAGAFIKNITGSYSNVVGLSLYDTMNILRSAGYKLPAGSQGEK